jgi:hypothetical protein
MSNLSHAETDPSTRSSGETLAAELEQHGVVSVPSTSFEWGGYRYSNPGDAIAAAKRGARS